MSISVGGVGDSAAVAIEGHAERVRQAFIDAVPVCPTCGVRLTIKAGWRGTNAPTVYCYNTACTKPEMWTPQRLEEITK